VIFETRPDCVIVSGMSSDDRQNDSGEERNLSDNEVAAVPVDEDETALGAEPVGPGEIAVRRASAKPPPLPPRGAAPAAPAVTAAAEGVRRRPRPAVIGGFIVLCAILGIGAGQLWNAFSQPEPAPAAPPSPASAEPAPPKPEKAVEAAPIRLEGLVVTEGEEEINGEDEADEKSEAEKREEDGVAGREENEAEIGGPTGAATTENP
jgi:hypothetical protein